jgi:beta-N-acetylhexosaminidase
MKSRAVNLDDLSDEIKNPKLDALAAHVADKAFTLVRDERHLFPMPAGGGSCLVIINEAQFSERGRTIADVLSHAAPDFRILLANSFMQEDVLKALAADAGQCKQVYVAAFVTVAAYRGSVALQGPLPGFLNRLVEGPAPVALISLGNPYLLRSFPGVAAYAATFSSAETSELSAARAILGEIAISGRLPVSIPGFAKIGEGLNVPATYTAASNRSR